MIAQPQSGECLRCSVIGLSSSSPPIQCPIALETCCVVGICFVGFVVEACMRQLKNLVVSIEPLRLWGFQILPRLVKDCGEAIRSF